MSENNLADIISALTSSKDFTDMVEKIKESGDLSSVISEMSSLLSTVNTTDEKAEAEKAGKTVYENVHENEAQSEEGRSNKSEASGLGSLLGGFLPLFASSISGCSPLLIALKPYLSKKRCDLIDSIVRLAKLASIVSLAK